MDPWFQPCNINRGLNPGEMNRVTHLASATEELGPIGREADMGYSPLLTLKHTHHVSLRLVVQGNYKTTAHE
jgi:hypothetical protein